MRARTAPVYVNLAQLLGRWPDRRVGLRQLHGRGGRRRVRQRQLTGYERCERLDRRPGQRHARRPRGQRRARRRRRASTSSTQATATTRCAAATPVRTRVTAAPAQTRIDVDAVDTVAADCERPRRPGPRTCPRDARPRPELRAPDAQGLPADQGTCPITAVNGCSGTITTEVLGRRARVSMAAVSAQPPGRAVLAEGRPDQGHEGEDLAQRPPPRAEAQARQLQRQRAHQDRRQQAVTVSKQVTVKAPRKSRRRADDPRAKRTNRAALGAGRGDPGPGRLCGADVAAGLRRRRRPVLRGVRLHRPHLRRRRALPDSRSPFRASGRPGSSRASGSRLGGRRDLLLGRLADLADPPLPGVSDGLWITFYPACYMAIVLLVRERMRHFPTSLWLDGLVGGLAASAIAAALVFGAIAGTPTRGPCGRPLVCAWRPASDRLRRRRLRPHRLAARPACCWSAPGSSPARSSDGFFLYDAAAGIPVDSTLMATCGPPRRCCSASRPGSPTVPEPVRFDGARVLLMPARSGSRPGLLVCTRSSR